VFGSQVELAEALGFPKLSAIDAERKWQKCLTAKAKSFLQDAEHSGKAVQTHWPTNRLFCVCTNFISTMPTTPKLPAGHCDF
jgi:hypothetical protein